MRPRGFAGKRSDAVTNNVSGVVRGSSLQAGTILGDVHLHTPPPPKSVVPRQLPAAPKAFAGRERELAVLTDTVDRDLDESATVAISAIGGMGGVGKTCLALQWAHHNRDRFPDGQMYVNLRGFDRSGKSLPSAVAVRGFLDALNVHVESIPTDVDAQAALYRSLVADRRMLIVLDNARDAEQVVPLLPGSKTCTVLITSRRRLSSLATAHGARLLSLDVLDEEEAVDLLAGHVGRARVDAEPGAVQDLVALCGRLPLALSIVGARASVYPNFALTEFVSELRDTRERLDALGSEDLQSDLRAVFDWSYLALRAGEARLFRLLGTITAPDTTKESAASLTGLSVHETSRCLRNLVEGHLLENHEPRRFRMHDLVRLYAGERAEQTESDSELAAVRRRWIDFHLHSATAASVLLDSRRTRAVIAPPVQGCTPMTFHDRETALTWLDSEHACLLSAGKLAMAHALHSSVWNLAFALDTFHWRRGHVHDHLAIWRDGLAAARHLTDLGVRGKAHRYLGFACSRAGRHDEAVEHLGLALELGREVGDVREQARAHQDLAHAWEQQGDHQRALRHALLAAPLFQEANSPVWEARALNLAGLYQARLGDQREARRLCELSLELSRLHGDPDGEAATLDCLADVALRSGDPSEAVALYRNALDLRRKLGNDYGAAESSDGLGRSYAALGSTDAARGALHHALGLYRSQNRSVEAEIVAELLHTLDRGPTTP